MPHGQWASRSSSGRRCIRWACTGSSATIPGKTASVRLEYRKAGAPAWRAGPPLFRVERGAHLREKLGSRIDVPADGWLFAGSVLLLEPATGYELRLTLVDPKRNR